MLSLKLSKGLRRLILEISSGELKGEHLLKFRENRQRNTPTGSGKDCKFLLQKVEKVAIISPG